MNRAWSVLEIKSVDAEQRRIKGIATTPSPDRMDDIVEPRGAEFKLPLPFLWQHDKYQPIGHVVAANVTDDGIEVEIQLAEVSEPGTLKDRLDEAWQSIKAQLVRGLSIGFQPKEYQEIANSWGLRFTKWAWHELSAVTIPANEDATILSVKAFDEQQQRAAPPAVTKTDPVPPAEVVPPAGATATPAVKTNPEPEVPKGVDAMNLAEKIKQALEQRTLKADAMKGILDRAGDTTLSEESQKEFDKLRAEVKQLDTHLENLKSMQSVDASTAQPVYGSQTQPGNGVTIAPAARVEPQLKLAPLSKGIGMARAMRYLWAAKGDWGRAEAFARRNSNEAPEVVQFIERAAVPAGNTTNSTWAAPLIQSGGIVADFVEYLRPATILGKFGTGNIPALRRVPFRVPLVSQTSGGSASWVGEGKAKPVTKFDFARTQLDPLKIAAIVVATKELLADSSPSADALLRDALVAACVERQDTDFVDPAKALSVGVSPASIVNGVTPINASGTDADALRADVKDVMAQFIAARNLPSSGVWLMDSLTALGISMMTKALTNEKEFPGLSVTGGTFQELPVIVSDYVRRNSNGGSLILVNASDIYYGDDGEFTLDLSTEASILMDSAPSMDSTTPTAAQLVSMFQTNSVAFLAERRLDWMKRRVQSVSWIQNTNYGG